MTKIIIAALFYMALFIGVEILTKKLKINKELSRKFIHIFSGVTIAFLPLLMSFHQIAILGGLFIPVMVLSKKRNIFSSIHHVKRQTYGEVYFPVAIVLTAILFPQKYLFMYGILIMAISDGFASVIGQKYGKKTYSILGSKKSYIGSSVFLVSSFLIGIVLTITLTSTSVLFSIIISLVCASILTILEGSLSLGLDNLFLPIIGAFFLEIFVKISK